MGIILTSDLKWKQHIARIQQKAFFVAYRIFYSFTSRNWYILLKAFKSFVLPILEHNSIIWSSHLKGDIHKIESVQRFFTKKLFRRCGIGSNGYEDRLSKLSIRSLEHRRLRTDLIWTFKIINNLVDIDLEPLFKFKTSTYNLRGHSQTLEKCKANTNTALSFFTSRVVRLWNLLPDNTVNSSTVDLFKSRIDKLDLKALYESTKVNSV